MYVQGSRHVNVLSQIKSDFHPLEVLVRSKTQLKVDGNYNSITKHSEP